MSHRVRVLEPLSARGLLPLCMAVGITNGVVATWVFAHFALVIGQLLMPVFQSHGAIVGVPLMSLLWITFPVLFAWLVVRLFQRIGKVLLCGLALGVGCYLGVLASHAARNPNDLLVPFVPTASGTDHMLLAIAISFAIIVLPTAVMIFGIALLIVRTFGYRVVSQTGTLCWSRGYEVGVASLHVCPECGDGFHPKSHPPVRFARATTKAMLWGWLLLALSLALAIVPVMWVTATYVLPSVRFSRAARPPAEPRESSIPYLSHAGDFASTSTAGWWIPDALGSTSGFAVEFLPQPGPDEPTLYVSRAFLDRTWAPAGIIDSGTPRINCLLREDLARRVIAAGTLPPELLEAIKQEGVKQGWTPKTFSGMWDEHPIDPTPFFPAEPSLPASDKH